ncbi:MAG: hypothetical protein KDI17_12660 [Halioglobus sp.]|nr:hypothetical protein [Halioglobus sp.]
MQLALLVITVTLGVFVLFSLRQVRTASEDHRQQDRRRAPGITQPFHAVSIEPARNSCLAARQAGSQRYLSEEAPALPLAECTERECECRYQHHADRRSGAGDRRLGPVEESDESEFWSLRNRRSFLVRRLAGK